MNNDFKPIALFDLDGTLCDYDKGLKDELNKIKSPKEPAIPITFRKLPNWLEARIKLIKSSVEWWANLPQFQLGFDIWECARVIDYRCMILTQGPRKNPNAWTGKKIWIEKNAWILGKDAENVTTTTDKSLVYGRVLVDDYPQYILKWLKWRPRGLVIMPDHRYNRYFKHKQVIRYTGNNVTELYDAMKKYKIKKGVI